MEESNRNDNENVNVLSTKESKRSVNPYSISLDDIRRMALLRYGSYSLIGRSFGGLGATYSHLILHGKKPIVKDRTIQKLANSLGVPFQVLRDLIPRTSKDIKTE
jgi:hypothetical protein